MQTFGQLFWCRILVGVGMGIFVPVNMSLITDLYRGDARTGLIGTAQAVNYLGAAVGTVIAGVLAAGGWRSVFWVNLAAAAVFLADLKWLPAMRNDAGRATRKFQILPGKAYFYALCGMAQMLAFYSCVTNFAVRAKEIGHGGAVYAGVGIACLYVGCFLTGVTLMQLKKWLKRWMMETAVILMAGGFLLLCCVPELWALYAGIFLVGLGDGAIIPALMAYTADACPAEYGGQAMATMNLGVSLGQFAAPVAFAAVQAAVGGTTAGAGFMGGFAVLAVVAGAGAVATMRRGHSKAAKV